MLDELVYLPIQANTFFVVKLQIKYLNKKLKQTYL